MAALTLLRFYIQLGNSAIRERDIRFAKVFVCAAQLTHTAQKWSNKKGRNLCTSPCSRDRILIFYKMATSKFPQYRDGDVVISLTSNEDENFILHSDVLTKFSDFFRHGLTGRWLQGKISGSKIVDNQTITMKRYELVEDEECEDLFLLEGKVWNAVA